MDDKSLIQQTLRGDEKAFEKLYESYKDKVFRLSLRILWDREDAMDATQETFVKAYRALGKFKGKASFSTWLYRITYNTAIDLLRKRSRRPETAIDEDEDRDARLAGGFQKPDRRIEKIQAGVVVESALAKLPEPQRMVVMLHDIEGLKYREIAKVMGCSMGTVMSRLHYARKKLKAMLESTKQGT
jgi:RNA polymerase sigma-70 factor (ECF subfamily)